MDFKMYYLDGKPCTTIDEFITCYNSQYYWMNYGVIAEEIIDGILKKDTPYTQKDVFDILAWKIGGIVRKETNVPENIQSKELSFNKSWIWTDEEPKGKNNGNEIGFENENGITTLKKLLEEVERVSIKQNKDWENTNFLGKPEEAAKILRGLAELQTPQVGSVYLITLLYFLTKGRWPIYDQYAYIALKEITEEGKKPYTGEIEYKDQMPSKNKKFLDEMGNIVSGKNQYTDYIKMLMSFEEEYAKEKGIGHNRSYVKSRDIDRALWAYGHCFPKKNKKSDRINHF